MVTMVRHLLPLLPLLALALCCTSLCEASSYSLSWKDLPVVNRRRDKVSKRRERPEGVPRTPWGDYHHISYYGHGPWIRDYGARDPIRPLNYGRRPRPNTTQLNAEDAKYVHEKSLHAVSVTEDGKRAVEAAQKKAETTQNAAKEAFKASTLANTTANASLNAFEALKKALKGKQTISIASEEDSALKGSLEEAVASINKTVEKSKQAITKFVEAANQTIALATDTNAGVYSLGFALDDAKEIKERFGAAYKNTSAAEDKADSAITSARHVYGYAMSTSTNTDAAKRHLESAVKSAEAAYRVMAAVKTPVSTEITPTISSTEIEKALGHVQTAAKEAHQAMEQAQKALNDAETSLRHAKRAVDHTVTLEGFIKAVEEAALAERKRTNPERVLFSCLSGSGRTVATVRSRNASGD
ncbi:hypothetical protein DQ04_06141000 [Trypanosoma grayi]|uniref:hypothetical protein n=1 Tax=Trypanosoma grayi TaxID=71804 RepID=UPI0004F45866|nr:hypothetical protein DQ04_06141000 [Trypanosoma grayi]KEG08937.1 hypothetical protein DQ04_06141000 [Trypanosoma grayi]